jgi:hypothetical protein
VVDSPACHVIRVPTWNVVAAGAAVPVAGAASVGGAGDVGGVAAATAAGAASTAANTADTTMGDRRIERGFGMAITGASNRTDVRRPSDGPPIRPGPTGIGHSSDGPSSTFTS